MAPVSTLLYALAAVTKGTYYPIGIFGDSGEVEEGNHIPTWATQSEYCEVPFFKSYFALQRGLNLTTVYAPTGAVTAVQTLPAPADNWWGASFDTQGVLWAVGFPATQNGIQSLWTVEGVATSSSSSSSSSQGQAKELNVTVQASGFDVYTGLLPCALSVGQSGLYWLTDAPNYQTMITTATLLPNPRGKQRVGNVSSVLYKGTGAIEAITAYTPPYGGPEGLLALDISGAHGPELLHVDPGTGQILASLFTWPATLDDDDAGDLVYDPASGHAWVLLATLGPAPYRSLFSLDLTGTAVPGTQAQILTNFTIDLDTTTVDVAGLALAPATARK